MSTRRDVLFGATAGAALALAAPALAQPRTRNADAWREAEAIVARVKPPTFPDRDFFLEDFGGDPQAVADSSQAFAKAIAACNAAGGGRVVVRPGEWLTGPIHLKSNVNLHLQKGATVRFKTDPKAYLPLVFTRWEGIELMNYSPFVYAFEQENIALTGEGVLDGQCSREHWWTWKGPWKQNQHGWTEGMPNQRPSRAKLFQMAEERVPVEQRIFGEGHYLRPPFIQPYRCKNVLLEGVSLRRSPFWQVHPVLCQNVTIRRLDINSHGPNNDGCDPESCRDVLIEDCFFSTGDDCIALNSGRNEDGRRLATPCENVVIRNCRMADGHGGLTIGSQISGGVRNVFAENCRLDSPDLDHAIRFKNNALRGGTLEHVRIRNIEVGQVRKAVVTVDFNYEEGANGRFRPVLRDVVVENVRSGKSTRAVDLQGLPKGEVSDITLLDCDFRGVAESSIIKHVTGLKLQNVQVNGRPVNSLASV
ncbi:glycoside hydrolase family 28 protein [Phenylobacterium deserti]|uniref:Glycoside hydrolase family 28 protein n=1 Tax=Phenylobacterium deserti TaxID=1914756 RepID=A0A328ARL2_9CAUL|nr:glycoside hydrolase family 28 protein [Phenylobacterium deserti]RAK56891.1 glycoside hydrolase family 28 protein [Phenylobacterium deserti]